MNNNDMWLKLMKLGAKTGCHQRADRSFFYKKSQFPLCARCTGVVIGYLLAIVVIPFFLFDFRLSILCCATMFIDWFVQYVGILKSTNMRRLLTGTIGGFGIITCEFNAILYAILALF